MSEQKTPAATTKQVHIKPKTYKMLRHAAIDMEIPLLQLTERIIEAGSRIVLAGNEIPTSSN